MTTPVVEIYFDKETGMTIPVAFLDLEIGVKGQVIYNKSTDTVSIQINTKYDNETQKKAFFHELEHIHRKDFDKESVQVIEAEAHEIATDQKPFDPEKRFSEERYQEAWKKWQRYFKRQKRKRQKEQRELEKRNEVLAHFGLEEVIEYKNETGEPQYVRTTRKKSMW